MPPQVKYQQSQKSGAREQSSDRKNKKGPVSISM